MNELTNDQITYGNFSTRRMTFISLFTALIAVFANIIPPITLPLIPVPITMQTMVVMLAGLFLRPTDAFLSMLLYICLGAIGLPVFSNWSGGMGVLAGTSGGFIFAFPIAAFLISGAVNIVEQTLGEHKILYIMSMLVINILFGIILINGIGSIGLSVLLKQSYVTSILMVLVFIPADLVKSVIAISVKLSLRDYKF